VTRIDPLSSADERPYEFPQLPIISASDIKPPPRKTEVEKYGSLLYLGIAGIVLVIGMVGWFAFGLWSLRGVWEDVYLLNDPSRPELDRVRAAQRLSRDSRLNDEQRMGMCLQRDLPPFARYLLAESVTTDAVAGDPRSFSLAVARSPDWPNWLRLLLTRRLASAAARGYAVPPGALVELAGHSDPMISLWASAAQALAAKDSAPAAIATLERAASDRKSTAELASLLLVAIRAPESERERRLDEITLWLRDHHPDSENIWKNWWISDGRIYKHGDSIPPS
jgi:hypothetical protein